MLSELRAEIFKLRQDGAFIRNLSLTSIMAITCICSLSDLQNHTKNAITPRTELAIAKINN